MIKQARQNQQQSPAPAAVIVGTGKNKVRSISHGGMMAAAMTGISFIIAEENKNGYTYVESIRVNNGELLLIFEK